MANKTYLDYAGLKRVLKHLLPGHRKIWYGTEAEWNSLAAAERDKYDQAEIKSITTDAYEDGYHTFDPTATVEGIHIDPVNGVANSYFRQGQLLIVNFHCRVHGTSTDSVWHKYYDPSDFIGPDEYLDKPWYVAVTPLFENPQSPAILSWYAALSGHLFWLEKDLSMDSLIYYQAVYLVKKR